MKKLISILLCLTFLTFPVSAIAEEDTTINNEAYVLLQELGIMPEGINLDETMTRSEFVEYVLNMKKISVNSGGTKYFEDVDSVHWAFSIVSTAVELNLIKGISNSKFLPDDIITLVDATTIILRALDYNKVMGSAEGAISQAVLVNDLDLWEGISPYGEFTKGDALRLIYNALFVECPEYDGSTIKFDEGNTILSKYYDVYEIEGIMTANSKTNLDGGNAASKNYIFVGTKEINDPQNKSREYLGYYVNAFVYESGDEYELISIIPDEKNTVVELEAKELYREHPLFSDTCIVKLADGGKAKKYEIAPDFDCIYNGVLYNGFDSDTFKIHMGSLKLISNDNDDIFDVVFVNEYENIVVERISSYDQTVIDKYTGSKTKLESTGQREVNIYNSDGTPANLSDIKRTNVLSVYKDKNNRFVDVYISKAYKMLTPTSKDVQSSEVRVGDELYYVSDSFAAYEGEVELGIRKTYYFDIKGYISAVDEEGAGGELYYGYLMKILKDDNTEKTLFRIFTESGEWVVYELYDKVQYNGARSTPEQTADNFKTAGVVDRQLIMYKADNDGILKQVWKATDKTAEENYYFDTDDEFTLDYSSTQAKYRGGNMQTVDSKYLLDSDTVVFIVSEDSDAEEDDFQVTTKSAISSESAQYNLKLYNINPDFSIPAVVSVQGRSESFGTYDPFFVVDEVIKAVGPEGDVMNKISGYENGKYVSYYAEDDVKDNTGWDTNGADGSVFLGVKVTELKRGDVIKRLVYNDGELYAFRIMHRAGNMDAYDETSTDIPSITDYNLYAALYTTSADVLSQHEKSIVILSNRLTATPTTRHIRSIPYNAARAIYIYDSQTDELVLSDANADMLGKRVFVAVVMTDVYCIVVYQ